MSTPSRKLGAFWKVKIYLDSYMHAPLLVEDVRTREFLMQEIMVQETLSLARQADIALLGIGALQSEAPGMIWLGYLNNQRQNGN